MGTTAGHDPVVGQTLKGTYLVERQLAAGGMGVIYLASHVRLPKKYAIKVLIQELARNENVITRFRREAEIVAALGHPHIVDVVDFDSLDTGQMYMVMEFLEGEDLADRLRRGRLGLASTVRLFTDLCDALDKAHSESVVHRDLKPANIFLITRSGRDDYGKILDFGISKILEAAGTQMTMDQAVMGTPSYMSPEQASGEITEIDQRTDIFALGAILFECLTGQLAYPGNTPLAVIAKICSEEPPKLLSYRPDAPPGLQDVILRALARQKRHRYAQAGELAQDLIIASGVPPELLGRPATHPARGASSSALAATVAPPMQSTLSAAASEHHSVPPTNMQQTAMGAGGGSKLWIAIVGLLAAAGVGIGLFAVLRGDSVAPGETLPSEPLPAEPRPPDRPVEPTPTLQSLGRMLPIPGGAYMMGTNTRGAQFDGPRHRVQVPPFWLAETEATNADYALFLRNHRSAVKPTGWKSREKIPNGKATYPVVGIDWEAASAYCRWAYPDGGRLPSEQQWEWAARGPDSNEYVWGNELDPQAANYGPDGARKRAAVRSFPRGNSRDGIYDLAGNVFEWTDSLLEYYDDRDIGTLRGRRVMRGGSFMTKEGDALRAWYRDYSVPAKTSDEIGFRCAWSASNTGMDRESR